jgi:DNA-directed RNA polymerase subunit RPC12/RpoP
MPQVCRCPECGQTVRLSEEQAGRVVSCANCSRKFRVAPRKAAARNESADDAPDEDYGAPPVRSRPAKSRKAARAFRWQPFLRRWLIAGGVVLTIAALTGIGGLFAEPLAIAATAICAAAVVGCLLAGTIWMVIDLGKENGGMAVCVLLVPAAGPAIAFLNKGPAQRGAVVFVSMFAPALLLGMMLLAYYPKYSGAGQQAAHAANFEDLIERMDARLTPETPVVSVTIRVASRPGALDGLEPECDSLLRRFKSYVPGSLKIDAANRQLSYQYRGDERFHKLYAFYLGSATRAFTPQQRLAEPGAPAAKQPQDAPAASTREPAP